MKDGFEDFELRVWKAKSRIREDWTSWEQGD